MDKNNTNAKPATAAKRAAVRRKPAKTAPATTPGFTSDDIALRAYFLSEKRRQLGLPGDAHADWLEAEGQFLAESGSRKKTARKTAR